MLYELLGFKQDEFPAGLGWHDRIAEGFPESSAWALARALGVQVSDIAELLELPDVNLEWARRKTALPVQASDTLFRVAVAFHRLNSLFQDPAQCTNWLRTARKEVGGQIPVLLLTTSAGAQAVFEVIERIKPVKKVEMNATEREEPSAEHAESEDDAPEEVR